MCKNNSNFMELFGDAKILRTGKGYRDMGNDPIVIPPDSDKQVHRLITLLGSLKAGNSADMGKEYSALLDELYKNNKINKKMYRMFYYKWKNLVKK